MNILSIDVGIIHLGLIGASLPETWKTDEDINIDITFCELVDLTELNIECIDTECKLYHDKVMCDYTNHLFVKYNSWFEEAHLIIIERQPICGLVVVEQLIMNKFRHKTILISPCSVIKYFNMSNSYDQRKIQTVKMAEDALSGQKQFVFNERRHDLADAYVLLLYYIKITKKQKRDNNTTIKSIQQFIYKQ